MFKISTDKNAISSSSGSNWINKSGIYDVTIKFASIDTAKTGAKSVNFNFDYNGNAQTIYGPYIYNKDEQPLEIGLKLINQLGIIAGLRAGDTPTVETETHNVGKDNKPQDFDVITEFSEVPVKVRIQMEYGKYNNDIQERRVIKAFFSSEGASAAEIIASENGDSVSIGTDLAKQEKYADNITYKDGLTAEDIEAWKAAKADGKGAASSKPTPKVVNKPATSLFGGKK